MSDAYVDASAVDDTGVGTIGDPKKIPDSGMSLITSAGDTLFFKRGEEWDYTTGGAFGTGMIMFKSATNGTSGSRITVTSYSTGALPIFDVETVNIGSYVYTLKIEDCDFWTIQDLDIRNVGSVTRNSSTEGGGVQAKSSEDTEVLNCNFDEIHDEAIVLQSMTGLNGLEDSNVIDNAGYFQQSGPTVNHYMMGASGSSSNPDNVTVTCSNNQVATANRGENITCNRGNFTIEDNEELGNETAGLYIDCGNFNTARNIFRRNIGYEGPDGSSGIEIGTETFHSAAAAAKSEGWNIYLNMMCGFEQGIRFGADHASAPDPIDEFRINKNSWVDNLVNYSLILLPGSSTNSEARHNISMPLTAGAIHDDGQGLPTSMTADYNYFDTSEDTTRHVDWQGANDSTGTALSLTGAGTLWRSATAIGDVVVEDYRPDASPFNTGTLNNPITGSNYTTYDLDANHDEAGALAETAGGGGPAVGNGGGVGLPSLTGQFKIRPK